MRGRVQNAEAPAAIRYLYGEAGWWADRHDQANFPDTFQAGKNPFLNEQIIKSGAYGANPTATRYACSNSFTWRKSSRSAKSAM